MSRDEVTRIVDRAKYELLALVSAELPKTESPLVMPEWLTAEQLAEYWQLRSKTGKVTTAGLLKWVARKPDDFPLPSARMGDLLRFKRDEVNQWAKDEAERRRAGKDKTVHQAGGTTDDASESRIHPL
ncbi:MAG: hypothetical protein ABR568_18480 [Pyrinomonadaceae bacterium]